ncbi:hypothetical protein [Telluria beijingensis]|uniref:hypothetical protein n=1 Tax=Telluria beijingensis TaxID=3068633 RepID=UPI0027952B24|nr:hypothetical protein [Massilia sp. REN29]
MSRQTLRNARQRIIGYIDTANDGRQTGRDERLRIVGYYDPRSNITRDERQRSVGHGNLIATLIGSGAAS